jgi:hypothetical protein
MSNIKLEQQDLRKICFPLSLADFEDVKEQKN